MKSVFILLVTSLFSYALIAQTCPNYFPMSTGAIWEVQNYDAKDKLESTSKTTVMSITNTSYGYDAVLETHTIDKKKIESTSQLNYKCENGVFYVDMSGFLQQLNVNKDDYKDMEVIIENSGLQYPSNLSMETKLPDASLSMKVLSSGLTIFSAIVNIVDRKIEGTEEITVPAGTFTATKISYTIQSKIAFVKSTMKITEWISTNAGVVRAENYTEKGKLLRYSVLSDLSR